MESTTSKIMILLASAVLLLFTYANWKATSDVLRRTCVQSVTGQADEKLNRDRVAFDRSPRKLTRAEFVDLMGIKPNYDSCNFGDTYEQLRLEIVDIPSRDYVSLRGWVPGPDGVSGTGDDISAGP